MAEKIVIAQLDIDVNQLIKNTAKLKKEIDLIKEDQKTLQALGKESSDSFIRNASDLKNLTRAYSQNIKALSTSSNSLRDNSEATNLLVNSLNNEVTTIAEARNQNKLLNKLRDQTNATTVEGQKIIADLNAKLDKNNEFIKANADQYLKQKINIGNYAESIDKALGGVKIFGVSLSELKSNLSSITDVLSKVKDDFIDTGSAIKNTKDATDGLSSVQKASFVSTQLLVGGLKLLKLALIATGIGAIVVILGSLITFLSTTQKGIDKVTSVTRPLTAVFQTLLGVIQKFGGKIFDDPLAALQKIFDFVKNQLVQSFTGLGKIIAGIFTFDSDKIAEGAQQIKDLADSNAKAIKDNLKGIADQAKEAFKIGQELDRLEKQLRQTRLSNTTAVSELTEELKAQNKIAEDQTKPINEREAAAARSIEVAKEINKLKQTELDLEIAILKNKQSRNDTSDAEKQELADLLAKRNEFNAQSLEIETTQQNKLNAIRKDAANQAKKLADEAIKEQQTQLQLFIAQQGTRAKTLEESLKISEEIFKRETDILKAELKNRNITQSQFEAQSLELQNKLLQDRANAVSEAAGRELQIFIEANQSKLENDKFFSDESLRIEQERLDAIAEKQKEFARIQFENGIINQTQFNDAINAIDNENRIANEEAQAKRDEAQKEKDAIDLENKRIADEEGFQNAFALEAQRLEQRRQQEIENAEKTGADINLINEKYAAFRNTLEQQVAEAKIQANEQSFNTIAGLLGRESGFGKIAASAAIINNTVQEATKAFNTAAVLAANPLTAALAPNATIQGVGIIARGAVQVGKLVTPKFEKGGISEVGGKRHSHGGTKYYGEDGNVFEAERGEGIGILNRAAFDTFMNFNNAFGSGLSRKGFFEGGGIISRAVPTNDSTGIELLNALQNMPPPIVTVEDIRSGNQSYVEVSDFANV